MAREATRQRLTEVPRERRSHSSRRRIAYLLQAAAHRLDPRIEPRTSAAWPDEQVRRRFNRLPVNTAPVNRRV
jgi:hypothetical protein